MKRALVVLALALLPSLAFAQGPGVYRSALVRYEVTDPAGGCTNRHLWWNMASDVLWMCENGNWVSTLNGVPAVGFPFTDTSGATTVTLDGDAAGESCSFSISNASEGAGFNCGVGAGLGMSAFAFNSTFSISAASFFNGSQDARYEEIVSAGSVEAKQRVQIIGEAADLPESWLSVTDGTATGTIKARVSGAVPELTMDMTDGSNSHQFSMKNSKHELIHNEGSTQGKLTVEAGDGNQGLTSTDGSNIASVTTDTDGPRARLHATDGTDSSTVLVDEEGVVLTANGNEGIRLTTIGSKPTCDSVIRGRIWRTEGGAGVADTAEMCTKDAGDAYAWRSLLP